MRTSGFEYGDGAYGNDGTVKITALWVGVSAVADEETKNCLYWFGLIRGG